MSRHLEDEVDSVLDVLRRRRAVLRHDVAQLRVVDVNREQPPRHRERRARVKVLCEAFDVECRRCHEQLERARFLRGRDRRGRAPALAGVAAAINRGGRGVARGRRAPRRDRALGADACRARR